MCPIKIQLNCFAVLTKFMIFVLKLSRDHRIWWCSNCFEGWGCWLCGDKSSFAEVGRWDVRKWRCCYCYYIKVTKKTVLISTLDENISKLLTDDNPYEKHTVVVDSLCLCCLHSMTLLALVWKSLLCLELEPSTCGWRDQSFSSIFSSLNRNALAINEWEY